MWQTLLCFSLLIVSSVAGHVNADGDQMCPHEYFKKHPDSFQKTVKMMKEKGVSVDFTKLPNCSENQKCPENRLCCKSPCGMKCMRPVTEKNAEEILQLIHKDIEVKEPMEPYVETEEDKKFGMCPQNYLRTHPEFQEKMKNAWQNKHHKHDHDGQCKGGKECPEKHKGKHHMPFHHLTAKPDCSADGDCQDQMRCCQTMCGKKCMKPVFTEEDYKKSVFGDKKKDRSERDLEQQEDGSNRAPGEELDHDKCICQLKEHGKGHEEEMEEGAEHGKGKGKKHGKGCKHCKGHGKGLEHGKGAKHGKGHGKGLEHGKGAKHGKGHGKGLEHGKGAKHGKGNDNELENDEGQENEGQVEEVAEHLREKRFAHNRETNNDDGEESESQPGKGEGKKKKEKANKRAKGKIKRSKEKEKEKEKKKLMKIKIN